MSLFRRTNNDQREEVKALREQLAVMQHAVNALTGDLSVAKSEGNPYPTYAEQVAALSQKYNGQARWGSQTAKNIIDLRASFIISDGIQPYVRQEHLDASREMDWVRAFMERNELDDAAPQEWAKEAEIEGKFLCRLVPNMADRQIDVRFVSWSQHGYTVVPADDDYAVYKSAYYTFKPSTGAESQYSAQKAGTPVNLKPEEFQYIRFGGRTNSVNDTPPKTAMVLVNIENAHKALSDWRKINGYFASPTPFFKTETKEQADVLRTAITDLHWRIGNVLIATAEFTMVTANMEGVSSIENEIIKNAQIISGATGIPIHFLGYPELMNNRSTAENLMEFIGASTKKDRQMWAAGYEDMIDKAMVMANKQFQAGLTPGRIGIDIPEASSEKIAALKNVWLPLRVDGQISQKTFLSKVPSLDVGEETERLQAEGAAALRDTVGMVVGGQYERDLPAPAGMGGNGHAH